MLLAISGKTVYIRIVWRACEEHTKLNEQFRQWLADYARQHDVADKVMATIRELQGKWNTGGRKCRREGMNER